MHPCASIIVNACILCVYYSVTIHGYSKHYAKNHLSMPSGAAKPGRDYLCGSKILVHNLPVDCQDQASGCRQADEKAGGVVDGSSMGQGMAVIFKI